MRALTGVVLELTASALRAPCRARLGFAVVLGSCLWGASAQAAPAPIVVDLRYDAPPECPGSELFLQQLQERNPRVAPIDEEVQTAVVEVTISRSETDLIGEVRVRAGANTTTRTVAGSDCHEVASALALVVAMTFDAWDPGFEPAPAPEAEPAPAPAPVPQPAPRPEFEPEPHRGFDTTIAGGVEWHSAPSPDPALWAPALGVLFEWASRGHPGIGLWIGHGRTRSENVDLGFTSHFRFTVISVFVCPYQWSPRTLRLGLCLTADVGALRALGDADRDGDATGPWFAPGAALRWQWVPGRWGLGTSAGATIPLIREQYYFELSGGQRGVEHQAPPWGLAASLFVTRALGE